MMTTHERGSIRYNAGEKEIKTNNPIIYRT